MKMTKHQTSTLGLKKKLRKRVDSAVTWTPWLKTYAKKGRAKSEEV
jgi:hypothetical protein